MKLATRPKQVWMTQRRCVGCGLRAELRVTEGGAERCPRCGVDWSVRPPRSYAELEGLETAAVLRAAVGHGDEKRGRQVSRTGRVLRGLEVGLFVLLVLVALAIASANIAAAFRGDLSVGAM